MGGTMQALLNKNSSPTTSGTQAASLQIMDTLLSPSEEASFQQWKAKYAPNDSGQDYDLRGAYKAGIDPIRMGWPEAFKKPNHPSYRAPMDKFETPLTPQEEIKFQAWKKQYAPNDSGFDYDFRGAFINGASPGADGHWDDQWKKPNHPTFSVLSRYAEQVPEKAGHWWPTGSLGRTIFPVVWHLLTLRFQSLALAQFQRILLRCGKVINLLIGTGRQLRMARFLPFLR